MRRKVNVTKFCDKKKGKFGIEFISDNPEGKTLNLIEKNVSKMSIIFGINWDKNLGKEKICQ